MQCLNWLMVTAMLHSWPSLRDRRAGMTLRYHTLVRMDLSYNLYCESHIFTMHVKNCSVLVVNPRCLPAVQRRPEICGCQFSHRTGMCLLSNLPTTVKPETNSCVTWSVRPRTTKGTLPRSTASHPIPLPPLFPHTILYHYTLNLRSIDLKITQDVC
jgi:hypothetical protein